MCGRSRMAISDMIIYDIHINIHIMMKYDDHGKNGLSSVSDCVAHISRYLNSSVGCKTNSGNCYCWLLQWLQLFLLVPLSDRLPQFPQVRSGVKGAAPKWEQSIIKSKRARDWLRGRRWEESRRIPSRRRQLRRKTKCFHRGKSNHSSGDRDKELRRGISPKFGQFRHSRHHGGLV